MSDDRPLTPEDAAPPRERAFNIDLRSSWGLVLIVALIGLTYGWQIWLEAATGDPWAPFEQALSARSLSEGRWWTLFTAMFMHAGLLHLGMNVGALLSFGMITARQMGPSAGGQLRFLAFYLLAGICGDVAFLLLHPGAGPMVGASGAIFGLWGAVVRFRRDGGLWPLFSGAVARQLVAPILANVLVVLFVAGTGAGVAWEAHLGGLVFGVLFVRAFLPRRA